MKIVKGTSIWRLPIIQPFSRTTVITFEIRESENRNIQQPRTQMKRKKGGNKMSRNIGNAVDGDLITNTTKVRHMRGEIAGVADQTLTTVKRSSKA